MTKSKFMCITSYAITRHYGGPEEGGWWWDMYAPIKTVYMPSRWSKERVLQACEKMHARSREEHEEGDISSVRGGVKVGTYAEYEYQEFATRERPHYE
jgi:hypothetical protein